MFYASAAEALSTAQGEIEEFSLAAEGEYRYALPLSAPHKLPDAVAFQEDARPLNNDRPILYAPTDILFDLFPFSRPPISPPPSLTFYPTAVCDLPAR